MLVDTDTFYKKYTAESETDRDVVLDLYRQTTDDAEFLSLSKKGYVMYLVVDTEQANSYQIVQANTDLDEHLTYIEQDNLIAVDALAFLREKLAS